MIFNMTPLYQAGVESQIDIIRYLLSKPEIDVNKIAILMLLYFKYHFNIFYF